MLVLLVALSLLLLAGCSKNTEANLVGKWKGEIKAASTAKDDPMAAMAEGMMNMFSINLGSKPTTSS